MRAAKALAINLRAARRLMGLTQEGLAHQAGMSRAMVAELESGEGNPRLGTLAQLAEVLHTTEAELISVSRAASSVRAKLTELEG